MPSFAIRCLIAVTGLLLSASYTLPAQAWGSHAVASYRVFEHMPEVAQAGPAVVESLEAFLKAQEPAIAKLLAEQEGWLRAQVPNYPPRPDALAFQADPTRSDDARRLAFLNALRIAHDSRFALYYELDAGAPSDGLVFLRHTDVSTLPGLPNAPRRFVALKPGEPVAALKVLASGAFEPDFGLDINLMDDSPSTWGKTYGFGNLPFGNPKLSFSTQAPFHMGFYHEDRILYLAAPFLKRTFPLVRVNQYADLAALAFRSGHTYWGWRFAGLALHYVQDLSQPYHASVSPGSGTLGLLGTNALAMAGFPKMKDDTVTLLSNRHLALENYQARVLALAASGGAGQALAKSLGHLVADQRYPAWSRLYARDVVAKEAYDYAPKLATAIVNSLPARFVSDPAFDFGAQEHQLDLLAALGSAPGAQRATLDAAVAELLTHFGAHSRNLVRGVLQAAK
ncbi:MAG: hypothetical protein RLZZ126_1517 [Pseudomonadota bacterium]|jgi:hypothetical protein